jgi:hypothetical protein
MIISQIFGYYFLWSSLPRGVWNDDPNAKCWFFYFHYYREYTSTNYPPLVTFLGENSRMAELVSF